MPKFPRTDVIEQQLDAVKETFESVDEAFLEKLRGGQMQARYGLPPQKPCKCKRKPCSCGSQRPKQ